MLNFLGAGFTQQVSSVATQKSSMIEEILLIVNINYLSKSRISFCKDFFGRWYRSLYLVSGEAKLGIAHIPCLGIRPWPLSTEVPWLSCYFSESNLLHPILKIWLQSTCFVIILEQV